MVDGYGLGGYGMAEPWGSVVIAAPPSEYSLGDFDFSVEARSEGYKIRIKFSAPAVADAPTWARRLIILRKTGEWPQAWDDPDTHTTIDDVFPGPGSFIIDEDGLQQGRIYYYALYMLRDDGTWLHDRFVDRGSAYPYDRWGCSDYIYGSLPRGWRTADVDSGSALETFISMFGALTDDMKTDCEHLLSLIRIDDIHADLIWVFDKKIAWPTWEAAGGIKKRKETKEAVDLYKTIGREAAYEAALEEVSDWNATVVEGWRYVFFSNGRYDCITPDLTTNHLPDPTKTDPIAQLRGTVDDVLRYTSSSVDWHSVAGLALFLEEIPGVSQGISQDMLNRFGTMIDLVKASYVIADLIIQPTSEENYDVTLWVTDEMLDDVITYSGAPFAVPIDTDVGATTSDAALFMGNALTSVTNDLSDRTYHVALTYV